MKMNLSAPVELWDSELPTKDYPACALKLYNLTDLLVISVEVTLLLLDQNGEEQSRVLYRAYDLHGEPGKTFRMAVPVQHAALPDSCEVVFEKVWFENETVWRRTRNSTVSFVSNVLPNGRELDMLKLVAGDTAVGYPDDQPNGWLCVCGRPNSYEQTECVRCRRNHQHILEHYNRESVEQAVAQRQEQLEARTRETLKASAQRQEQRAQHDELRKKRRRRITAAVAAVVVVGMLAYGTVFHLLPFVRYQNAVDAFQAGRYAEAQTAFADMEDYRDAADYVLRCRYEQAKALMTSADAAKLLQAESAMTALGEYQDAAAKAIEARTLRADVLLNAGELVSARELYVSLNDAAKITECDYLIACDMQQNGDYAAAMQAFAALGEYADATARQTACTLKHAAAMLAADQEPNDVLSLLSALPEDHQDAASLRKQAWYKQGKAQQAAGNNAEAARYYLRAGDYLDAHALAMVCVYEPACAAQEAGNLMAAVQLFASIPGYEDADERLYACNYALAEAAVDDMEYKLAATLLAQLPEDDENANKLRHECIYRPASAAMTKKDYAAAIEGFAQLGDYADSAKQLQKARYAYAQQLESTDPDAAMALYEDLGDYQEAAKKLRTLRYNTAVAAQADGAYDRAETLFNQLGEYRDCAKRIQQIHYARAEALIAEHPDEAIAAFEALGEYSDSAKRIQQIRYAQAEALAAEHPDEAMAAFDALGEYSDAADRANQLRYAAAEALVAEHPDEAIAAFDALGEYSDAADRANQLRYAAAEALVAEHSDEAIAAFDALGEYSDSAARAQQLRYQQAELLQTGGDLEHALSLYQALGEYGDSADRVLAIKYQLAQNMAANGDYEDAIAAFTALGEYSDAAAQINAVRYMQAEAQLAEGDPEAAISTFTALGEYADSSDRILGVLYDEAAKLAAAGNYTDAEAAYTALGEYSDSADRVLKMRYCQAEMTLSTGAWEAAKAAFAALGEYDDAATRMLDCDLLHANQLIEAGDEAAAETLLVSLGSYSGAADTLKALYYRQAQRLEAVGSREEAAALYLKAGDYEDAAERAEVCLQVFSVPYEQAQAAAAEGDAAKVIDILRKVNLTAVPERFQPMLTLYADAAVKQANHLMASGDPEAAAVLLEQLPSAVTAIMPDYANLHSNACAAAVKRLMAENKEDQAKPYLLRVRNADTMALMADRADLLLLGAWTDDEHTYVFYPDGTCRIDGESLHYALDGYNILTGAAPDALTVTHKVAVMPGEQLQLRDVRRGGNVRLTLNWAVPTELEPLAKAE